MKLAVKLYGQRVAKNIMNGSHNIIFTNSGMCMPLIRLSEDNTIVIPPEILQKIGVIPGGSFEIEEVNGAIVVRPTLQTPQLPRERESAGNTDVLDAMRRKNLEVDIQFAKGVGPKLSLQLLKLEIRTVEDMLYH
ncbi:MAG: hypothetical protein PHC49_12405, partial [Desulfuromonadaceae bacterium]|nr:hypothetical protein [Desulfuromonadaceae bacterium]